MKQALLVIDLQEVFFGLPENQLFHSERLLENVNEVIRKVREKNTPVFFIQHTTQDEQDEFFEGGDDWQLHHRLSRMPEDPVFRKTTWDSFYQTGLLEELRRRDIEQLIIAGAQTEFCLDTTIRAAFSAGFQNTLLVKDTHSTLDSRVLPASEIMKHHENVWNRRFLTIVDVESLT